MTPRQFLYGASIAGGAILGSLVWVVMFLVVSWVICAYGWPMAPCWKCRGKRTKPGSSKKRFGSCTACGGSGMRQVIGSKQVHRAVRSLIAYKKKEN